MLISREDLEGLLNEYNVAYEQAQQLQTIIENLQKIKAEAIRKALEEIKANFTAEYPKNCFGDLELGGRVCTFGLIKVIEIIDKYKTESEDKG